VFRHFYVHFTQVWRRPNRSNQAVSVPANDIEKTCRQTRDVVRDRSGCSGVAYQTNVNRLTFFLKLVSLAPSPEILTTIHLYGAAGDRFNLTS
jgi:hypothetical protein